MSTTKERDLDDDRPSGRLNVLDWEGARVFLEVGRTGSLRAASLSLHQSVNALRRRLEKLEKSVGTTLLTRHVDGVRLTAEGERVLATAKRMEAATFELIRGDNPIGADQGEVTVAATEGLGAAWIGPQLASYRRLHPLQSVNLQCGMPLPDVLRLEADIAVQLVRPQAKDLKIVKLGRLHAMPFASHAYLAAHGMPKSFADLAGHDLVYQIADQVTPSKEIPHDVRAAIQMGSIVLKTNSSLAQYFAVVAGVGIGMLPTYIRCFGTSLVPIELNYRTTHDIWLVYHPDAGRLGRVQMMIAWLIDLFSPRKYPWFNDTFINPDEMVLSPDSRHPFSLIADTSRIEEKAAR